MVEWHAIVLTCPSKNNSIAYQKELELRQAKGWISKESLVICIEDPEEPIGSGGATLNALLVVAEALSAQKQYKMTQVEVLKDKYILIMHMGRQYPFDIVGKAFCTLPFQDASSHTLLTNFDLLYSTMSDKIACLSASDAEERSDPGIYVCSTDMIIFMPEAERVLIRHSQICVLSSLTDDATARKNGIYELDEQNKLVRNLFYQPDDSVLAKLSSTPDRHGNKSKYNLITGIVYFNYEVAHTLYSLLLFSPIDACSYIGIDSGASPLCLSLFFDILLATCSGIERDEYLSGAFKTNHAVSRNQASVLRQARATLWHALRSFRIDNVTVDASTLCTYMDNETFAHRRQLFADYTRFASLNSTLVANKSNSTAGATILNCMLSSSDNVEAGAGSFIVNTVVENTRLKVGPGAHVLNSHLSSCGSVDIGANTVISDLVLVANQASALHVPGDLFVQCVELNAECFKTSIQLNVVFGMRDNLSATFDSDGDNTQWTLMNEPWSSFTARTSIDASDLWPLSNGGGVTRRSWLNAKLYPVMHMALTDAEMSDMRLFFWTNLMTTTTTLRPLGSSCVAGAVSNNSNSNSVKKWRQSVRFSVEEIVLLVSLAKLFERRRRLFNRVSTSYLVESVVHMRPIHFARFTRNAIHDGYAEHILRLLERAALGNGGASGGGDQQQQAAYLACLPRIMMFIANTLCEMAGRASSVRSGPALNVNWSNAFQLVESGQIEAALRELFKERLNWMHRNDLLIRASRHFEAATLAFIRQATSSFVSDSKHLNRIILEPIAEKRSFEWVEAVSPARLDLAGAWSDTPPITYEAPGGSCVTNVAILVNGVKPIGARARIFVVAPSKKNSVRIVMKHSSAEAQDDNQVSLEFTDLAEFRDYNKPQAVACLMKAVCIFTRLVELENASSLHEQLAAKLNGSLELHTWTGLPHGSGLGTSSILAACILKVVWYLMGVRVSNETLSYSILIVEQLMTTNGGWQDQVGGIWGGFKFTTAKDRLPLELSVEAMNARAEFVDMVNSRLVLIYTGLTRLAKDLLINVIRNWYSISTEIYENVQALIANGIRCRKAIENENIIELGECINKHRQQKLVMAPGSEPDSVQELTRLLEPLVLGMALAGAGGGGFIYVLTKKPHLKDEIQKLIDSSNLNMQIYEACISNDGIEFNFF